MPRLRVRITTTVMVLIAGLSSFSISAQDKPWFRVELLIFTNEIPTQPIGASKAEQWDATPNLVYPSATRFLVDAQRVAQNAEEFGGESLLDEYGRQIITILTGPQPMPAVPVISPPSPIAATVADPAATPEAAGPAPLKPVYSGAEQAAPPASLPRPYVLLADTYKEFQGKTAQLQQGGRHSVLFHQSWVQPMNQEADSLPIVLDRSGDEQQWPRLQGTVKLYLTRYLQLETNLWLNTAGEYFPGSWQMPAPPFGPASLIIEEEAPIDIAAAVEQILPEQELQPAELVAETEVALAPIEESPPVYPYRHAVLLDQTRRMRSTEVHYIDHPMLGVIVKLTPLTGAELTAIATAQAGL